MVGILSTVKIRYLDYYLETIVNINLIYQAGGIYQSKYRLLVRLLSKYESQYFNTSIKRDLIVNTAKDLPNVSKDKSKGLKRYDNGNTHSVEEARFVSSCLSCPSRASPHLSLLLASSGVSMYTLFRVEPEPSGKPSLKEMKFLVVISS